MIDTHCHLDFDAFDGRRETVIEEANAAGVHTIINIGVDLKSSLCSLELTAKHDCVYAAVGVHPHDARTFTAEISQKLRELAGLDKIVAIGEIGLDFYRDLSPRSVQKKIFRQQLELAAELELPVVIHTRQSFNETINIVKDYADNLVGGVFHCFPGDINDARRVMDLGFVISVGGVITFKKSRMADMAARVPLDKIILETDAPYLTPEPFRGKTNSPAYVKYVYQKLAELKDIDPEEVERIVDRTAQKLFRLIDTFEG